MAGWGVSPRMGAARALGLRGWRWGGWWVRVLGCGAVGGGHGACIKRWPRSLATARLEPLCRSCSPLMGVPPAAGAQGSLRLLLASPRATLGLGREPLLCRAAHGARSPSDRCTVRGARGPGGWIPTPGTCPPHLLGRRAGAGPGGWGCGTDVGQGRRGAALGLGRPVPGWVAGSDRILGAPWRPHRTRTRWAGAAAPVASAGKGIALPPERRSVPAGAGAGPALVKAWGPGPAASWMPSRCGQREVGVI